MAEARIYQRYRNGMQASRAATEEWVLEFESKTARRPDPLTGWSGGADTQNQVVIVFASLEEAKAYAEREGVDVHIVPPSNRKLKLQSYADNFVTGKITY
ncbi:MAG TPA: NADH dehydrogenase ubiquinone Fe-S protein 4 [Allosphingosinicella sp.]